METNIELFRICICLCPWKDPQTDLWEYLNAKKGEYRQVASKRGVL